MSEDKKFWCETCGKYWAPYPLPVCHDCKPAMEKGFRRGLERAKSIITEKCSAYANRLDSDHKYPDRSREVIHAMICLEAAIEREKDAKLLEDCGTLGIAASLSDSRIEKLEAVVEAVEELMWWDNNVLDTSGRDCVTGDRVPVACKEYRDAVEKVMKALEALKS